VALACFVVTVASYLGYLPFDDWSYLRFLLPGMPALIGLNSVVLVATAARLPRRVASIVLAGVAVALAWHGLAETRERHVFGWANDEQRYASIGRFIDERLPSNAVLFAMQHSGSARYYSERPTVRYDMIEPSRLDPLVAALVRHGLRPYFLLEAWEEPVFRDRFGNASRWGALDWAPLAETATPSVVRLYDPRDRDASPPRGATITIP
jgi:hypothetical protein